MPRKYMKRKRYRRRGKVVTKRALPWLLRKSREKKFYASGTSTTVAISHSFPFTTIANGPDQDERVGNAIDISGLIMRWVCLPDASTVAPSFIRIIVYQTRVVGAAVFPISGFTDIPDPDKFIIWRDVTGRVPYSNGFGKGMGVVKLKFKPYMKALYDGTAATTITQGELLCYVTINSGAVSALFTYDFRLTFTDA